LVPAISSVPPNTNKIDFQNRRNTWPGKPEHYGVDTDGHT
jgi:hypothetical protein